MYAYIDRKKKLPVTTLLRAIGYESDKDILEIFDLAEEVLSTNNPLNSKGWTSVKNEPFCRHLKLYWEVFNLFFIFRLAVA